MILNLMTENPEISAEQIANSIKTTKRRVEYHIHQLKKTGRVERIGADKNGHWVVKTGKPNE
jgi:predicted HTH transcriptional regulator